MIITKDFIILNLPKTGSSFVRQVIKEIYYSRRNKNLFTKVVHKLKLKQVGFREVFVAHPIIPNYKDQHGCLDQIPDGNKGKVILSVVRDPYNRLESFYKFRWWVQNPSIEKKQIENHFPDFPNLTFEQYLKMQALKNDKIKLQCGISPDLKIGNQSIQFIRFYFKNHKEVLATLDEDYIKKGKFKKDLCEICFLRNENLNEELAQFLSNYEFSKKELDFVRMHEKVNVTKNDAKKSFLNQEVIEYINDKEWILFEILSSLCLNYRRN